MKSFYLFSAVLGSLPGLTIASAGSILFEGYITENACIIESNDVSQVVDLGTISTSAFSAAGQVASPTRFTISLKDCPQTVKSVSFTFNGVSDQNNPTLISLDDDSSASGIGIALYEYDSVSQIPLFSASKVRELNADTDVNVLTFIAKYMATQAKVTPGTANSVTEFVAVYN